MDLSTSPLVFWAIAVLLIVVALAFVLPPLLRRGARFDAAERRNINIAVYRDQLQELEADQRNGLLSEAQFGTAKVELEARLAEDALAGSAPSEAPARAGRTVGIVIALLLPLIALGVYLRHGMPDAVQVPSQASPGNEMALWAAQIEARAKASPDDAEAWLMLGKARQMGDDWSGAEAAFAKAYALAPQQAAVLSGYAEVLAVQAGKQLDGRPMELVNQALAIDPRDMKALELSGIHAFQTGQYAKAAEALDKLSALLPPDSPYADDIRGALAEARRLGGLATPATPAATGPDFIRGTLDIAPALKGQLQPEDMVVVFARSAEGGAPLAALRLQASQLPAAFELNDSMAMNPAMRLSNAKTVSLMVRVPKSGQIKGAPGDLEGSLDGVQVGSSGVALRIDTVRK